MTYEHVALAFMHPHEYSGIFGQGLWRTVAEHPGLLVIDVSSGPMIATSRNQIADTFLDNTGADILFMVDADMAWSPAKFDKILGHVSEESPIVGGLCFVVGRKGILSPTIAVSTKDQGMQTVWDYPKDALVSCDATGAAFLAVHRVVFERLRETYGEHPYPYFADSGHGPRQYGEDFTMCIRARQHGFPVKVDTGCRVGHVKPYIYTEDDYVAQRSRIAAIGQERVELEQLRRMGLVEDEEAEPLNRHERRRLARTR